MRAYIIRRLLLAIPTVFLVSLIVFFTIRFIPADAVDALLGQLEDFGGNVEELRPQVESALGMDVSIPTQYGRWLGVVPQADGSFSGLFQGNLGKSFWRETTVVEDIALRLPITLELAILSFMIAQLIALPIGIYSAVRQDTWGDYIGRSFAIICLAIPGFWLGTMIIVFPSIWWGYFPPLTYTSFFEDPIRNLQMFIIPSAVLGMHMAGGTMRVTRTMMLEVLRADYIRTAWAKGLRERVVVIRHTLKNALIPVITQIGLYVPFLIGGAVIIEQIFVLPGLGSLIIDAAQYRDYPMLSGSLLVFGVGMVLVNLVIDLAYGYLDPRIRYK